MQCARFSFNTIRGESTVSRSGSKFAGILLRKSWIFLGVLSCLNTFISFSVKPNIKVKKRKKYINLFNHNFNSYGEERLHFQPFAQRMLFSLNTSDMPLILTPMNKELPPRYIAEVIPTNSNFPSRTAYIPPPEFPGLIWASEMKAVSGSSRTNFESSTEVICPCVTFSNNPRGQPMT